MYGTVARFRLKPGMEGKLTEHLLEFDAAKVPGAVAEYLYRMDQDPSEYYMAVVFDSKEAYLANANGPEQDARYRKLLELLVGEPEWHDGAISYGHTLSDRHAGQK